jgi:alpha-2-macroglobulin
MTSSRPFSQFSVPVCLLVLLFGAHVAGQEPDSPEDTRPSFSLSTSTIATTRETPAIYLTFRRLDHIDFRVYRVNDPMKFLAGLKDPHQLGSEEPIVSQVPTLLERVADWKANWRWEIRNFFRSQFSWDYRRARRQQMDQQTVVQRRTTNVNSFAQVPLLNPSQLVTSWREILPPLRDADVRRIPIDIKQPGMYVVEAVLPPHKAYTVVIISDIGLVTKAAPGQVLLFAADRATGKPVSGCDAQVLHNQKVIASGQTGADGVLDARFTESATDDVVAVAKCGDQVTATDPGSYYMNSPARELVGYVYTDKPIYRPGHTVHIKGFLRWRSHGALQPFDAPDAEIRVSDTTDKVIFRQRRKVDAFGGITADLPLSAGVALGGYSIAILVGDEAASGGFEVQEYRKPEFEVRATPTDKFVVQDGDAHVAISARYYFGQPVAGARVSWVAHRQPYYSPLRWSDEEPEEGGGYWWGGEEEALEGTARLDANGKAEITIPVEVDEHGNDYSLRVEARVTDPSSREVSGFTTVNATYGSFLIASTVDQYVVKSGATTTVDIRAVDYFGAPVANHDVKIAVASRVPSKSWDDEGGTLAVATSTVKTDAEGRAQWTFTAPATPADYRIRVTAETDDRPVHDDTFVWVPGAHQTSEEDYSTERYLELIPDKKSVAPGESVKLLVRGAEFDADVLVTKEAQDVSWHQVTHAKTNETVDVPIGPEDIGDTWVNVAFLSKDKLYRAERKIKVPAVSRQLHVSLTAEKAVSKPREPGRFLLKATDANGAPVKGQFSLAVIDEAVYGVKPDTTPDPLQFFYQRAYSRVGTQFSREYSFVGYSGHQQLMLAMRHRPYSLADFKSDKPAQPTVRKEFPDAIYWIGDIVTDEKGEARVQVTYPDALTTWRLTARGITGDSRVGASIARTTVTKDLIVRVITPRFLAEGDEVGVPVITHNYLPGEKQIDVTLAATGLTPKSGPAGAAPVSTAHVTLPSAGESRLDWRFTADTVGTATVTGKGITDADGDAVQLSLPVLPFGLRREVAKAGSILRSGTGTATLAIPATSNPAARTVQISLAPSLAGSLLGAIDYLADYPYGCTEQTLSSFLPSVTVARTMAALKLQPTERLSRVDRYATAGLQRLLDYQHDDGGWGWWKTDENDPFMTAYATYGLLETKAAGYKVPEDRLRSGVTAVAKLYRKYPRATPALKAYMVYVMERAAADAYEAGDLEDGPFVLKTALEDVYSSRDSLTPYGRALLLLALDATKDTRAGALAHDLLAEAKHTGDLAWWENPTDPLLDDWDDTSVESTATAVRALVAHDPTNPTLEAAVRYMIANRQGTYWFSTKQTAMVLYGLTAYMQARGESGAPSEVDVTVNGAPLKTVKFDQQSLVAPDPVVVSAPGREGDNAVGITAKGNGAVYWTATARYFDTRTPIERTGDRKLAIARDYYSLSSVPAGKQKILYRETPFSGTAKPGDVLLVHLVVAGATDWRYLLIEDMLPAGVETIADDDLYPLEHRRPRPWGERREFRDDRAVFFQDGLPGGRVDLWYLVKVVTPGVFRAMPAQVTPMYVPGVSASTTVQTVTVTTPTEGGTK